MPLVNEIYFSRTGRKEKHKWHALINETGERDIVWHSLRSILIIIPKPLKGYDRIYTSLKTMGINGRDSLFSLPISS